ncbi:M48 family metallopeptidase [Mangrovicoccus sp. HB161399]|uniref:M48 family metallopeptidase n=1 Tax=Mangrovicoccus sp. HB161399 TaxID=2720392 RepID=UPI001552E044|nr:M48 family metallopeptidase [Mangrovicoccus sp. HB161399]
MSLGRSAVLSMLLGAVVAVQGCTVAVAPQSSGSTRVPQAKTESGTPAPAPATKNFATIVARVEPVAEQVCRSTPGTRNCDYRIVLDRDPSKPANAYQTLLDSGQPMLVVNQTLIDDLKNADEIAFVISHEAAHHIEDHIPRQQSSTEAAAIAAGLAAAALGGNSAVIANAQQIGAFAGSRAYSKDYELEADSLGAQIAYYAGYDPVVGIGYFTRARDPGDQFLGTHPPNAERIKEVKDTMARLERQQ